jgi:hypothetical protein
MRLRNVTLFIATITLLSVASGDATENRLRIEVSPRISAAPAAVRIRAYVTPDSANRALQVVADSGSFYRSSLVPLDGANAALITETIFRDLPGGEYEVSVALVATSGGRTVDKREVKVTSSLVD